MKKTLYTLLLSVFLFSSVAIAAPQIQAATQAPTATTSTESTQATTEPVSEEDAEEVDPGVIGLFGLNWKLFLAQLINFGIVLFVLWKWVWKPVTSGMEARTKRIEDSLNDADRITKEKAEFETWKNAEMSKARGEASTIINEAKTNAEEVKNQILEQTKNEQQNLINRAQVEMNNQKIKVLAEAQSEIAGLVVQATEKLLRSKLTAKTDQKLIDAALKESGE